MDFTMEFDMKYHILHVFSFVYVKEKLLHHFKNLHNLKLLTNFDVNLTSSPGGVMN